MGKKYVTISNEERLNLIRLITETKLSVAQASQVTQIYYPTAKAIARIYKTENRVLRKKKYPDALAVQTQM